MTEIKLSNEIFKGANGKESLYDLHVPENWNRRLVVFIHGFMGFKDWGCWNLVSDFFVNQHYGFLKYNVSHNGCSIESPDHFVDLESFSFNDYMKEISDLDNIIKLVNDKYTDVNEIYLIGHSRGGGIALLQSQNPNISKVAAWAAIADIEKRFPTGEDLESWKKTKVRHITNGRTGQKMPLHIEQYHNYLENRNRLNIREFCLNSEVPTIVIHGKNDTSVLVQEGEQISEWLKNSLIRVPNTAHTFDSSHPWNEDHLPEALEQVCAVTLSFFDSEFETRDEDKLSMLSDLITLAKSDNEIRDVEFEFLHSLALQMGVSTNDFRELFDKYIKFNPPKMEVARIVQFQRLILLMNVDQESSEEEINYIKDIGIRMGLNPRATDEILSIMHNYENMVIPPDKLISIFKTFHN
jgi:pimeloyl-ACP methyl ester carboxylesterase